MAVRALAWSAVALWLSLASWGGGGGAAAQDRAATLAEIRQELATLTGQIESLRRELRPGDGDGDGNGGAGAAPAPADAAPLARLDAIEAELRRLTAASETLAHRIDRIVADGTNRIDDLKFRLTELEGGDIGAIPPTPPLGGEAGPTPSAPMPPPAAAPDLAVGERGDFEAAVALTTEGTPADAHEALQRFLDTYPRSPLAAEAQLLRGDMLEALGNPGQAGRAYLESYTLAEETDPGIASEALLKLGLALAALEQTREACITVGQVADGFPGTAAALRAAATLGDLGCE